MMIIIITVIVTIIPIVAVIITIAIIVITKGMIKTIVIAISSDYIYTYCFPYFSFCQKIFFALCL